MLNIITACTVLCVMNGKAILGLDERSAMEKRCSKTFPNAFEGLDYNWVQSVETWYVTHGSRLEIYRLASRADNKPIDEINEDDLYYHSCFQVKWGTHPVLLGFHGKKSEATAKLISPSVFKFTTTNYEIGGTAVMTLTDNKTFQFMYKCYDDGEATWVVISTVDDLDKKTENLIHEHARFLGFHGKYFTELEFEMCEGSNVQSDEL